MGRKSQLAIEWAHRIRDRSPETWVFWVHASGAARFEQSFRDIADIAKIAGRQDAQVTIFKLVHDWLRDERHGKWVLILDNVDDAGFLVQTTYAEGRTHGTGGGSSRPLREYIPHCPNGSVLVTTRNRSAALELVEEKGFILVEPMDQAHATALLKKKLENVEERLEIQFPNEDVAELAAALEFMPLAIVQAGAYISERAPRCSVRQYLEQFQKSDRRRTSLLDHEGGQLRRDREAKNSIVITWQLSFDSIRDTRPSAADLLSLMSFFDRQGIPDTLLKDRGKDGACQKAAKEGGDDDNEDEDYLLQSSQNEEFEKDVVTLRNFSFISINADGTTFEMHRLVQLATRTWLEAHGMLERWKQQFLKNLCAEFPDGKYENWATCRRLFPHTQFAAAQRPQAQESLRDWSDILYHAGWYAWNMGNGVEAEKMSVAAMRVREKMLGREHEDSLNIMALVASVYKGQGRWEAVEELQVEVVETSKKKLGADHPNTLTSMANLVSTYVYQGRWQAAEELGLEVLETSKKILGADHPDTLTSMGNLASTYWGQGRYTEAVGLMRECVQRRQRILGLAHPRYIISSRVLAMWEAERASKGAHVASS